MESLASANSSGSNKNTNNAAATNTTSSNNITTNTYKDLWTFDLNDTGDIQHKLRVVRVNNRDDNIAITRFNFVPQLGKYWPSGSQYFLPIEHWPKLKIAFESLIPVANALYRENAIYREFLGCNRLGDDEGRGAAAVRGPDCGGAASGHTCSSSVGNNTDSASTPSPRTTILSQNSFQSLAAKLGTDRVAGFISRSATTPKIPFVARDIAIKRPRGRPPKSLEQRAEEERARKAGEQTSPSSPNLKPIPIPLECSASATAGASVSVDGCSKSKRSRSSAMCDRDANECDDTDDDDCTCLDDA